MKRYDTPEAQAAALEVFLFDTLSDPNLEITDAPAEPAYNPDSAPAPTAEGMHEMLRVTINGVTVLVHHDTIMECEDRAQLRMLIAALVKPVKGASSRTKRTMVRFLVIASTRLEQLTD